MTAVFREGNIRSRQVTTLATHSPLIYKIYDELLYHYKLAFPESKLRSKKWISSAFEESDPQMDQTCSAEYFLANTCRPIALVEAVRRIPENAIIIEIGPHAYLINVIKGDVHNSCEIIGLVRKEDPELMRFLKVCLV